MPNDQDASGGQNNTGAATTETGASGGAENLLGDSPGGAGVDDAGGAGGADALLADEANKGAGADGQGGADGEGKPDGEESKPTGAPEAYEDFAMPEGVTLDTDLATELKAAAKEANLPQDAAQKFADLGAKLIQKAEQKHLAAMQQQITDWTTQSKNHPEFGGDKLAENLGIAKTALETFGTPALKTMLIETGLGNHPEVLALLVKAGKAIGEDSMVRGAATSQVGGAKSLYNNSQMN
jgi:hypothetical protein